MKGRAVAQVIFLFGVAVSMAPLSRGDGGGGMKAAREQARLCDRKQEALRPDFEKSVSEHVACTEASDCAVLTPGCPFDCYVGVRGSDVALVEARARELISKLGDCRCMYRCIGKPKVSCVQGKCAVEISR